MPPAPKPRRPRKQRADPRFSTNHPPELIARALLDADQFGDKVAAERYGVHRNTIANWRLAAPAAPLVSSEMERLREEVRAGWIDRAKEVRLKAIERVGELLGEARNLTSAVNAARRIHEIILSDEILNEDPGAAADALDDDQPHEPDRAEAQGQAQGAIGSGGDDGQGDLEGGEG